MYFLMKILFTVLLRRGFCPDNKESFLIQHFEKDQLNSVYDIESCVTNRHHIFFTLVEK
ncbi:rCG21312 [Rattus norvegicus]|uniref:RCG21312 n=1 Tax=Rattus norvegicus TaxID=10116 RepID=A6J2C1_RAT|nr:rCG21312 [Rattus norvegicus]